MWKRYAFVIACAIFVIMELGMMFERIMDKKYYRAGFSGLLAIIQAMYLYRAIFF